MPKTARTPDEVLEIRNRILDEAILLITDKGFNNLSMRAIASRIGMTAANIYNYYKNKDELYLDIQTRGFAQLQECLRQAIYDNPDPRQGIEAVMRAYLSFGLSFPSLYEIMFILNTPKYADYQHTSLEPIASFEKETALKAARLLVDAVKAIPAPLSLVSAADAYFRVMQIWTALHGIISLYNSRVLQEAAEDTEAVIDRCVREYGRLVIRDLDPKKRRRR